MPETISAKKLKQTCVYCGDSPTIHVYAYFSNLLSYITEPFFNKVTKILPLEARMWVEKFLRFLLIILTKIRIVTFSNDPEKATTLRSRVIWDEASRRGIPMRQLVVFGLHTDNYEARVNKHRIFFDSLPIPARMIDLKRNWDDKFYLKKHLVANNIPAPKCISVSIFDRDLESLFDKLTKPVIVKPRYGSRGRHTTTGIETKESLVEAIKLAFKLCPVAVVEEHLDGYVCRATCVDGKLLGFYRADAPYIVGDGKHTVFELIKIKDASRVERVSEVKINQEIEDYLKRLKLNLNSIPAKGQKIRLTHRTGRLFGGETKEMLPQLHSSFVPIIEKAASVTGLPVAGFDLIIPNPEISANQQRWGIIEVNTLPFIDLHYYALYGKPTNNIAGCVWDLWNKK